MIEQISADRCTACNICVEVCPTRVFDAVSDAPPTIARQTDCQSCFMCELYCPVDALYVAPQTQPLSTSEREQLPAPTLWGSYRRSVGWHQRDASTAGGDLSYRLLGTVR